MPVCARQPEQIEQIEPRKGEWQAQYFGTFGRGDDHGQAIEGMFGASDKVAIGVELEAERGADGLSFESIGPKLLYRITGDDAPVELGVQVQASLGKRVTVEEAELRLIAERKDERWWSQLNGMIRRSNSDGQETAGLAYAWSIQRQVGGIGWLGLEGSGGADVGKGGEHSDHGHFIGPSLTLEFEAAREHEIELGIAALHRISGDGSKATIRLFAQVTI